MTDELGSIVRGTAGLGVAAAVALWLSLVRRPRDGASAEARRVRRVAGVAVAAQAIHFLEEWYTGFHVRFPALLGLAPWSSTFFVTFNACWIAIWIVSVACLGAMPRALVLPIWFLAIASVANGVAHPLASIVSGGYFPGLWSSPVVGILGVLALRALGAFTADTRNLATRF